MSGAGQAPNGARGEAALELGGETFTLRPSFAALVAAESELGPLFALVERAAEGRLSLSEMAGLFWHCLVDPPGGLTREALGEAIVAAGLAKLSPVLRGILRQILAGR
ncbi:gene transfer agent family protein [Sphingobium sp.]|uniref:gene transfer agent family protein n=1 Tax=Sphingobium sp. TaxID=1912891 RepID=UPI0035C763AE